jgi:hypothetical protein
MKSRFGVGLSGGRKEVRVSGRHTQGRVRPGPSDGKREKWDVSGPHFGGWEIYHRQGIARRPESAVCVAVQRLVRAVDPALERRRQDVGAGGQQVRLRRRARHSPVVRRHAAPLGVQARLASGTVADRSGHGLRRSGRRRLVPLNRRRADVAGTLRTARPRLGPPLAAGRRRNVPAHHPSGSQRPWPDLHRHLGRRRLPHRRCGQDVEADQPGTEVATHSRPNAEVGHCVHRIAMHPSRPKCCSCRSTGT